MPSMGSRPLRAAPATMEMTLPRSHPPPHGIVVALGICIALLLLSCHISIKIMERKEF